MDDETAVLMTAPTPSNIPLCCMYSAPQAVATQSSTIDRKRPTAASLVVWYLEVKDLAKGLEDLAELAPVRLDVHVAHVNASAGHVFTLHLHAVGAPLLHHRHLLMDRRRTRWVAGRGRRAGVETAAIERDHDALAIELDVLKLVHSISGLRHCGESRLDEAHHV